MLAKNLDTFCISISCRALVDSLMVVVVMLGHFRVRGKGGGGGGGGGKNKDTIITACTKTLNLKNYESLSFQKKIIVQILSTATEMSVQIRKNLKVLEYWNT